MCLHEQGLYTILQLCKQNNLVTTYLDQYEKHSSPSTKELHDQNLN